MKISDIQVTAIHPERWGNDYVSNTALDIDISKCV